MNMLRSAVMVTTILFLGVGCGGGSSLQAPEEGAGPPMRSALSPPASPGSPLAAFATSTGAPRVYFLGSGTDVSELAWKPGWHYDDVTSGAMAPPAEAGSRVAAFAVSGDLPRVYDVVSNHVHELWWDGQHWHDHDLCTLTGAPDVAPNSALVGMALDASNSRVYYVSSDLHVWQLAWTGSSWSAQDLTQLSTGPNGGTSAGRADMLTAFVVNNGSGPLARVYFVGSNHHVYELWSSGGLQSWGCQDLNVLTNAPAVQDGAGMTGLVVNASLGRVYYVSTSLHVVELRWTGLGWTSSDVTAVAQAPATVTSSALTSFVMNGNQPRVYFISNPAQVYELWYDGNTWYNDNLTARALAPAPQANSPLAGMALPAGQARVYYLGNGNDVDELGWNGTGWGYADVTAAAN